MLAVAINAEMHFSFFTFHINNSFKTDYAKLGLTLTALSFLTFIFSIGIKLFIRHPVVLFGILILSKQFNGFMQLPPVYS